MKKSTNVVRIILQVIVSFGLLSAGVLKLMGNVNEVTLFSLVHLMSVMVAIGVLEILVAIMLWFKKTRTVAVLFATAILGAAFAETITASGGMTIEVLAPGLVLLLTWGIFAVDACTSKNITA